MRKSRLPVLAVPLSLAARHGGTADHPLARAGDGRYLGVGVYPAGPLWARLAVRSTIPQIPAATIADDEHVIVLVDSRTGAVRQCGDLSAVCIGIDPWRRPLAMPEGGPAVLTRHAADLEAEAKKEH